MTNLVSVFGDVATFNMPPHTVSNDIKARIAVLFYQQDYSVKEICGILGIKKSLAYKTLAYARTYGVPYNPHSHRTGRWRQLNRDNLNFIQALVDRQHCIYLDEIQDELYEQHGVDISVPSLTRTLRRLCFSRKCVSAHALERNDILRSAFMNTIADEVTDPDQLMFVDEAARNRKTSGRSKGWALVGRRCVQRRFFVRGQRYSILPILTMDGIITHDIIPGSVTSERFVQFLRELVVSLSFVLLHIY